MTDKEKQEAKELTSRATRQARSAAKNTVRAAKIVAPAVAEDVGDVVEEAVDVVSDNGNQAVNVIKKGLKLIPSTRGKYFVSCAVTGVGLAFMMRYYAIDVVERTFTSEQAKKLADEVATDLSEKS